MTGPSTLTDPAVECPAGSPVTDLPEVIRHTMQNAVMVEAGSDALQAAIDHHFRSPGGYLRARLGYHTASALGIESHHAITVASISELLHNASLIHDDVLDRDTRRRGQASVWHQWNEGVAICLGDLFISAAFGLIAGLDTFASRLPPLITLVHEHVRATIHGQLSSLSPRLHASDRFRRYAEAARGKSGPLFGLALEAPLVLTGHHEARMNARHATGAFATIFQLADDIEDYDADMALDPEYGAGNMLRALERISSEPLPRARSYSDLLLARSQRLAGRLPAASGTALTDECDLLRTRIHGLTGASG
ncbi:geranylgeranyl diphosphate synthase type II [Kushneria sinocarnis]|uniref:Geranylgeranyl diphosphate synthase type II n=1 Tax=Kushneria sinocarnis TaxID=595502 RepID=A0A420WVG0_9GAMM|nr:polyprenyl synthetase family protein [Kushneria sinocarnis]RKR02550.1 geranylgeranyl diphosphate synthase type II [Kushneria sinocarnis]